MRKIVVPAVISFVVVIGAALLFFFLSSDGRPDRPYSGASGTPLVEDDLDVATGDVNLSGRTKIATRTTSATEDLSPAEEGATLSGTVRDEFGDPIAGAEVFLRADNNEFRGRGGDFTQVIRDRILRRGVSTRDTELALTTTDERGEYAFFLATIARGDYQVYARRDEYAAAYEPWTWTPESSVVDFRLASGSFITGIVLDRRDLPIVGAVVEAYPDGDRGRGGGFGGRRGGGGRGRGGDFRSLADRTTTDFEGAFRLSLSSGTYRITADSDEHTSDSVADVATGTQDVVVVLEPSKQLSGRVVNETGQPISEALVALYSSSRFGRGGFGRGGDRGRGRGGRGDRGGDGEDGGDRGRGGRERPSMMRFLSSPRAEAMTDGSGQFRFTDVPAEGYALITGKSGYVTAQVSGTLSGGDAEVADAAAAGEQVTVTLADAAVMSGVVKDPDGAGVAGVFVAVATDTGDREERFGRGGFGRGFGRGDRGDRGGRGGRGDRGGRGGSEDGDEESMPEEEAAPPPPEPVSPFSLADGTETDASGRFNFDTLPPGQYSLSVESEQHPVYREDGIALEKEDERRVEIVLEKGLSLRGKVLSRQGGEPVQKARLSFRISDRQRRSVETNDEGEYEVAGLLATNIAEVQIVAAGYTDGFFEDVEILARPETQEYDFELQPGASVAGTIRDTSGNAVYNARVSLTPAIDVEIDVEGGDFDFADMRSTFRRTFSQTERTRSDVEGAYIFDEVGGGMSFRLEVEHPDYRSLRSDVITVAPGESLVGVDLQLKMGARIVVLALDGGSMPLPGARVSIERQRTPVENEAAREARRQSEEERRARRSEDDGEEGDERTRRRRGPDVREMVQRIVSRGEEDAVRRSRNTGPDGQAIFSGMSGGVYLVRVSGAAHQNFFGQANALEDESVTVTADLLPENVILGIVQDRFGEPVPGAEVEASRTRENPATVSFQTESEEEDDNRRRGRDRSRLREEEDDRTDEEGRFRVGQLADGVYALRVRARGFSELRMEDVSVNREQTIVLERLGAVAGVVVVTETSQPITTFRLRLVDEKASGGEARRGRGGDPEDGGGDGGFGRGGFGRGGRDFGDFNRRRGERWRSFNDPAGAFLLENINPGRYSLEVLADGFAGASVPVTVQDGLVTDGVQISLAEGLSISGVVVRKGSTEPVAGARIYLVDVTPPASESETESRRRSTPSSRRTESDPSERSGRRTRASRRSEGEEAKLAFATLEAAKKSSGGNPLQSTDDFGYFKLLEVTIGRYMLVVDHDEFVPVRKEIRIDDDRILPETRIDLDLGATLKGTITLPDEQPNVGVTVVLQTADGYSRRAETDVGGRYTVTGLIAGDYSLSVRASGGLVVRGQQVEIEDGNNTFDYRPEK